MTDITTISGDPEVLRIGDTNNEDPLLSSQRDEEKTMLAVDPCGVAPTAPRMEQAPPQPAVLVVSDPDAAAGPPLPPPPPLPLPPPPVVPPVTASSSSISPPPTPKPVVSSSKKSRPPYKYDPEKITLRFLFANRDGLTVTVECNPGDTISEVKGALLSVWPEGLPDCSGGDQLRLICMGKGILMPDTRTLEDLQVPVFKTHPTPVNVSVRPDSVLPNPLQSKNGTSGAGGAGGHRGSHGRNSHNHAHSGNNHGASQSNSGTMTSQQQADQGCTCIIL